MRKFNNVAVGGTFDEFHRGHKTLLAKAFEIGEHVLIGLSTEEFANRMKKPHIVASYQQRLKELQDFLEKNKWSERATIIPLSDPFGAAGSKECVDALVVSKETEKAALEINKVREVIELPALEVIVIDMVPSENHGSISTTRIRRGEIDREGHVLKQTTD